MVFLSTHRHLQAFLPPLWEASSLQSKVLEPSLLPHSHRQALPGAGILLRQPSLAYVCH